MLALAYVRNSSPSMYADQEMTPPAPSLPTLQARKQQLVRDAIWDAAIDLFARKGFDETTVDDIAQAAGTSRRSFFRYFESKSDLMAQGVVNYGATLSDTIQSFPASYSLSEVFRETVLRVVKQSAAHPRTRKVMQIAAKYPAAREAQTSRLAEVQDRVAEAFARRCKKGAKDDLAANLLASLILPVVGAAMRSWFENDQQDISLTVHQVFATLDRLLCSEPAASKRKQKPRGN